MTKDEIIQLFHDKPRHAGRILASLTELSEIPGTSVPEKAYNYCYPGSHERFKVCLHCGESFKSFISFNQGYRHYCSPQCSNASDTVKNNKKLGMLSKYGVENAMQSAEIKSKAQATNLSRYGHITPLRQDSVQEKVKKNLLDKYGVDHAFKIDAVKKTAKTQKNLNYKVERWSERLALIEDRCKVTLQGSRDYQGIGATYTWKHECGEIYESSVTSGSILACPKCKIKFRSEGEDNLASYIQTKVKNVLKNVHLISPYELDIFCPDLNLAVEYNGLYWHSDVWKTPDYHLKKLKACEKKGIKLIQIFEDEWLNKPDIVKSRLDSIIGSSTKIYARKCNLREVSALDAQTFLEDNHIQGATRSSVRLGLYQKDVLVALMTFGKPRFSKKHDWELLRYCSLRGTTIVGGASKLLSSFRTKHTGSIISYADRRWSTGNLYQSLGMTQAGSSPPGYFYVKNGNRINRVTAQKHKLRDLLGEKFDESLTEQENMARSGYLRIYDCGHHIFVM